MYGLLNSDYEVFHRKGVFGEALLIFHNSRKKKKTSLKVNYIITRLHISGKCKIKIKYENLLMEFERIVI